MLDLGRQGLTTASVGKKGGWVDEAAKGGNTHERGAMHGLDLRGPYAELPVVVLMLPDEREHARPISSDASFHVCRLMYVIYIYIQWFLFLRGLFFHIHLPD